MHHIHIKKMTTQSESISWLFSINTLSLKVAIKKIPLKNCSKHLKYAQDLVPRQSDQVSPKKLIFDYTLHSGQSPDQMFQMSIDK